MLYTDGNGFPLTLKPSHLFGSTERMDAAEVLSAIVEEACRYEPVSPVDEMFKSTSVEQKVARTSVERKGARTSVKQKEALTSVEQKVFVASSDLVRFEWNCIELLKVVGLPTCLA